MTKQFAAKVTVCEKSQFSSKNVDNQTELLDGYNVILEDTILFPEGGGQVNCPQS